MAKSKRHLSRRKKINNKKRRGTVSFVLNGRLITRTGEIQEVHAEPAKVFVEKYLSPKGVRLLSEWKEGLQKGYTKKKEFLKEEKEIWRKYGKNRYHKYSVAVVKEIIHER